MNLPPEIEVSGLPPIPDELPERLSPWFAFQPPAWGDWHHRDGLFVLAAAKGVRQVCHQTGPDSSPESLTEFEQPVSLVRSRPGGRGLLLSMCHGGDENEQLWYWEQGREPRRLTQGPARCMGPLWSPDGQRIAFASNQPDPLQHAIHVLGIDTDEKACLTSEGNWYPMSWSPDGRLLALQRVYSNTHTAPWVLDTLSGELEPLYAGEGGLLCTHAAWSRDGSRLYHVSDRYGEFRQLICRQWPGEQEELLPGQGDWDVEQLAISGCGRYLACSVNQAGSSRLHVLTEAEHRPVEFPLLPEMVIHKLFFHPSKPLLALEIAAAESSRQIRILDIDKLKWTSWTDEPQERKTAPTRLFHYPSFDGLEIPCFYFPATVAKAPVLIDFHGGPEEQARPVLSNLQRYWRDRGMAILTPNVRGSSGYGKHYMALDDGYLREDAVRDAGALLDWIERQPELDASRVAVIGGSYGGYMVTASLAHYADRLRAGIEMMGICDFVTYLEQTSPYRQDSRRAEFGDERDPEMRAFLERISPLRMADRMRKPLFVLQGLNDPRVPVSQAEQIVASLRERGIEVWYMLARNEGHGLTRRANADYFCAAATLFLENFLLS